MSRDHLTMIRPGAYSGIYQIGDAVCRQFAALRANGERFAYIASRKFETLLKDLNITQTIPMHMSDEQVREMVTEFHTHLLRSYDAHDEFVSERAVQVAWETFLLPAIPEDALTPERARLLAAKYIDVISKEHVHEESAIAKKALRNANAQAATVTHAEEDSVDTIEPPARRPLPKGWSVMRNDGPNPRRH